MKRDRTKILVSSEEATVCIHTCDCVHTHMSLVPGLVALSEYRASQILDIVIMTQVRHRMYVDKCVHECVHEVCA